MRKLFYAIVALAAALSLHSCQKKENGGMPSGDADFYATIASVDTRTSMTSDGFVTWNKSDRISVNGAQYVISSILTPTNAEFKFERGVKPARGPYHAFYPQNIQCSSDSVGFLQPVQKYEAGQISNVPMYSYSETESLSFHNIFAVLKIDVESAIRVRKIVVQANDKPLSGSFHVSPSTFSVTMQGDCSDNVVLDCGDPGVAGTTFYIAVPAGDYTGADFNVKVIESNEFGEEVPYVQYLRGGAEVVLVQNTVYPFEFRSPENDFRHLLNYFTTNVAATAPGRDYSPLFTAFNLCGDDVLSADDGRHPHIAALNDFSYDADNEVLVTLFDGLVSTADLASQFINYWEDAKGGKPSAGQGACEVAIAKARVIRAYAEYLLAMGWGDAPLIAEPLEVYGDSLGNSGRRDILDWITTELEESIPNLPEKTYLGHHEAATDITRVCAEMILAKISWALTELDPAKAKELAQKYISQLIDLNNYELYPSEDDNGGPYLNLFHKAGNGLDEKIWELKIEPGDDGFSLFDWRSSSFVADPASVYTGGIYGCGCLGAANWVGELRGGDFGDDRRDIVKHIKNAVCWGFDSRYLQKYRNQALNELDPDAQYQSHDLGIKKEGLPGQSFYLPFKQVRSLDTDLGANIVIFRYADVILMAAHAAYRGWTMTGTVKDYIDMVRRRAGVYSGPDVQNLDDIMDELTREFFMEGHRWIDINCMSTGKAFERLKQRSVVKTVLYDKFTRMPEAGEDVTWEAGTEENSRFYTVTTPTGKPGFQEKHKLFPFPPAFIEKYSRMKQNPGW